MVVSAILTTALAPITGALFGASYGTSIRIGYEIIFPALFGDVINDQKNNPTKLQEEGTKRTIESMHKMFTGVGGAAAMEFGIEQGIEMAKKKTESQDVQDMIDLNLGITDRQLNKRGKAQQFQDPLKDAPTFPKVKKFFEKNLGDFQGQSNAEIIKFFKEFTKREQFDNAFNLLQKEKGNTSFTQLIWKLRPAAANVQQVIESVTTPGSFVAKAANLFQVMKNWLVALKLHSKIKDPSKKSVAMSKDKKGFLSIAKKYNQLVAANGKPKMQVDTAKSITAMKIIPK